MPHGRGLVAPLMGPAVALPASRGGGLARAAGGRTSWPLPFASWMMNTVDSTTSRLYPLPVLILLVR